MMRYIFIILLVAMASCSAPRQRDILDTIPSTSEYVMNINIDAILKKAGCDKRQGIFILTPELTSLIARADSSALALLLAVVDQGYCLDLTQVYAVKCMDKWMMTAPRIPMSELRGEPERIRIPSLGTCQSLDLGMGYTLIANEMQVWIGHDESSMLSAQLDKMIIAADLEPLSAKTTIVEYVLGEADLKCYYRIPDDFTNPLGGKIMAALTKLNLSERMMELNMEFIGSNSPAAPFSGLPPIESLHLQGMPLGTIAYLAIGIGPQTLSNLEPLRRGLPFATQLALNALIALSDPEGGTISLGLAPGGSAETIKKLSLENWLVRAKLPMGEKAVDAAELINKFSTDNLYCYAEDDALAITSYDIDDYPSEQQDVMLPADARIWIWAQIPYRSQIMKALSIGNGYQLELCATENKVRSTLNILGPVQFLLPALIRDLNGY